MLIVEKKIIIHAFLAVRQVQIAIYGQGVVTVVLGGGRNRPGSGNTVSKEDKETLDYFNSLREAFTETELLQVLEIISTLSYTKHCIPSVLDLLKEEGEGETENLQATDEDLKENAARF